VLEVVLVEMVLVEVVLAASAAWRLPAPPADALVAAWADVELAARDVPVVPTPVVPLVG